jgi:copper(I)-binding protein
MLHTGIAAAAVWASPSARACEYETGLLRITHPWVRATSADATTAAMFMRFDEVNTADRLIGVSTPVATGAEMGGAQTGVAVSIPVPADSVTELSDGGMHVRLTGLKHQLHPGRNYALTLEFERSGTVLARLTVEYPTQRFF